MKISVIIPTLDERDCIRKAVASARDDNADQIVVCDGGSADGTPAIARELGCQVIQSSPGRGQQLAQGATVATGDVLVFLHADSVLTTGCLKQIRQRATDGSWGCFQHQIDASGRRFRWLEKGNSWRARFRGLVYGDQTLWVHRKIYESVGGFAGVPLMEDVRISEALRKTGAPLILPGPVRISARHWLRHGVIRTTLRNQFLMGLYRCGFSPDRISSLYRR